ncbi:hypothetical protein N9P25_02020 [Flavobacteriaceae bacterium]|nr:hypothetical protein [Flavobacteriaceae bacterium]
MKIKGTYSVVGDSYELDVNYIYYWDDGNYENPPECDLEIENVELNGVDISEFYWDWVHDNLYQNVWEHAQENKDE